MAKLIPYDVTGVEEGGGGTGVKVKPGVYPARIALAEFRDKKSDGSPANDIRLGLDVGAAYDWVFTYIGLGESTDWKLAEFVRAIGLKDKGNINCEKLVKDKTLLRVKINPGSYDGNYAPNAGKLFKAQPGDEELLGSNVSESSSGDAPDADDVNQNADSVYADGFLPSREGDPDIGSYDDWEDDDLAAEVEDRGLTLPGGRGTKRNKMITALRAEDNEVADGTGDEPAGVATDDGDDYDDWDIDQLKTEWEERQLGDLPNIRGSNAEGRLKTKIIETLREDDGSDPFRG